MDQLVFDKENRARIQEVENSFRPSGKPLSKLGRILVGEGRLLKQGRKKMATKGFFLFNDILVYGTPIMRGRWYKKQKIIPLENIELEDTGGCQWLLRTPSKSFFVSAPSIEEKKEWMGHIKECQAELLKDVGRKPSKKFAKSWIPDQAAEKCMRCLNKFTQTRRRHHCRSCGFLVCDPCSKHRVVLSHIDPTERQRICLLCHTLMNEEKVSRQRGDSGGNPTLSWCSSEEEEMAGSGDEEEDIQTYAASNWLDSQMGTWGKMNTYDYPRPARLAAVASHTN